MQPITFLSLLPLAALAGCVTINTVSDGIARAPMGMTAKAGPLLVVPTRLIEDSRCPQGVQCVWAGRVRISVTVNGGEPVELTLRQPVAVGTGMLTLAEVYPEPRKDVTRYPDEYRFGFTFRP